LQLADAAAAFTNNTTTAKGQTPLR